jgi:hypothetical protein
MGTYLGIPASLLVLLYLLLQGLALTRRVSGNPVWPLPAELAPAEPDAQALADARARIAERMRRNPGRKG